ncbi:Nitrogen metabolite regulation-like protein bik4 [Paramyrothecium foliicola]|nr:Nitrogen metabolite regulation-like protein bik4 [Paramyrothecium foliicola]
MESYFSNKANNKIIKFSVFVPPLKKTPINVLVFGATGTVGVATVLAAQENGANVYLAVRNLNRPLPNMSLEEERKQGFVRVKADLLKPDTLEAAAKKTKATRAFIYLAPGSSDHMKASLEALKLGGVEFVVFLSSASVQGDPRNVRSDWALAHPHAQVEVSVEEVFGKEGNIAVRPAFFATNSLWWKDTILDGYVRLGFPDLKQDWISPQDIGRVSGKILVDKPATLDGADAEFWAIRLYGPSYMSLQDGLKTIGRALGKDLEITPISDEEFFKFLTGFMPKTWAKYLINAFREGTSSSSGPQIEASGNIEKYSGRQPTKLKQWVEEKKGQYTA